MKFYKDYWELREIIKTLIPRRTQLESMVKHKGLVREKGRKVNYSEFNFEKDQYEVKQRLLNEEEITSFLEISLRATACPMPLNADVWDGLYCIAEGQLVTMEKGSKKIEDVKIGDKVATYNEQTKKVEFSSVLRITSSKKTDLIEINTEYGVLEVTEDHQVFTKRGWVLAKDLTEEDYLLEII
jgi:hypothetical protein